LGEKIGQTLKYESNNLVLKQASLVVNITFIYALHAFARDIPLLKSIITLY